MGNIFISYRRSDTGDMCDRMYDWLVQRIGRKHVFKDVDSIPPGRNFYAYIERAIYDSSAIIVLIGTQWLRDPTTGRNRLFDANDPVRYEIETAIRLNKPIIPVLVNNGGIPNSQYLPASLQKLPFTNALPIRRDPDFQADMQRLAIRGLRQYQPIRKYPRIFYTLSSTISVFSLLIIALLTVFLFTPLSPIIRSSSSTATISKESLIYAAQDFQTVIAINRNTGKIVWKKNLTQNASLYRLNYQPDIAKSCVGNCRNFEISDIDNSTIYINPSNGYVYALNAYSGQEIWRFQTGITGEEVIRPLAINGILYAPLDSDVVALQNGNQLWRFQTKGKIFSHLQFLNNVLYITSSDGTIYAVDAQNGNQVWNVPIGTTNVTPVFINSNKDVAVVASGNIYLLDISTGKQISHLSLPANAASVTLYGENFLGGGFLIAYNNGTKSEIDDLYYLYDQNGGLNKLEHLIDTTGQVIEFSDGCTFTCVRTEDSIISLNGNGSLQWKISAETPYSDENKTITMVYSDNILYYVEPASVTAYNITSKNIQWQLKDSGFMACMSLGV